MTHGELIEIQRLGWTLLHFLWQGTAIAMVYALLRGLTRCTLSAQGRYLLACLALAAMTLAPFVTYVAMPRGPESLPVVPPVLAWHISASDWQRILPIFVAVWIAGVVICSLRLIGGWRLIGRLRRASHPAPSEWQQRMDEIAARLKTSRPVQLLVSSLVDVPTVIGWLQPIVLIPLGTLAVLPAEQVSALLAHELAHIRRHDYIASVLQGIAEALLFYHPAVWWVSEQIREERELCCDDLAVAATNDVLTYAMALAKLESLQPPRLKPALAANGGSLVNRICRLLEPSQPAANQLPAAGAAWAMILLWMTGLGVATVHAAQTLPVPLSPGSSVVTLPKRSVSTPGFVEEARSTLLFDPFLPATNEQPKDSKPAVTARTWTGNLPLRSASDEKKIAVPLTEEHPIQAVAYANPLPKVMMRDLASIPVASSPATPADDEVLHSATHLVQVEVVVRDNRGPVQGLKESDFRLFENGEARAIGTFNVSVAAPSLTVEERQNALRANRLKPSQPPMATHSAGPSATVIFIDRSGISAEADRVARQRVAEILQVLPADEPVAVCALDVAFRVISEFSDPAENRAKAVDAVWQLHPGTSPDLRTTKLIALDAITGQLSKLPGRKNLIWVSDNFPVDGEDLSATFNAHLGRTLHALNAANVAMLPVPLEVPVRRVFPVSSDASSFPAQSTGMQFGFNPAYWAEQTGGTSAFHTDAATAVRRTFEDARVTYTLGFYPENLNGSYHDLKVVVGHRHVEVKSRRGYMAAVSDVTANRIAGEGLESRVAANSGTSAMDASMQLPYFYIGNNRASLHVSVDVVPAGITFREDRNGLHGQIEIVGIATRPDGRQAARFADVVNIDLKDQEQADAFMRTPWHYEHPLTVAVGSYIFGVEIGLGPKLVGAKTMSLNIEPWSTDSFGIGGIAFSKTAKPVETMPGVHAKALVAAGEEFIESATNRFNKSDHVYFYTEVYDPALTAAKASVLAMEYRVLDRNTGELKADTGMAGVNGYIRPGSPTVPFATTLPVTQLQPGSYRLEVRAGHVSGSDVIERAVDFDVN